MLKVCIGIISYFPEEEGIRKIRVERLRKLLDRCRYTFNLPFIIVAQNWKEEIFVTEDMTVCKYGKLGITGARKALREKFLETDYDYIICFDDDFEINTDKMKGQMYLDYINVHPNCLIEYENYLMNLLAVSRYVAKNFDFDNISAEDGTGFEDWIYVSKIQAVRPELYFRVNGLGIPIKKRSELVNDTFSTWQNDPDINKNDITTKSLKIINEYRERHGKNKI